MSLSKIENLEVVSVSYLCAAASHVGLRRHKNEDKFLIDPLYNFFLVVDGMGGHSGGEIAAQTAVETIADRIKVSTGDDETRLKHSIICANNAICRASRSNDRLSGMGCVLTALLLNEGLASIANVGDARVYKLHNGILELLTTDHSIVGELGKNGELSEIRLMRHPRRNEVLRCVGIEERMTDEEDFVNLIRTDFQPEHAFLMCSDGLSDLVTSARILDIIHTHAESPKTIVRALVDEANEAGGTDNITAIFIMGERFSQAVESSKSNPFLSYKERITLILLSRWVTLLYGFILGATIGWLLRS